MNIVLQQYGLDYFNVWEDVNINHKSDALHSIGGLYRVHKYHSKIHDRELSYCNWSYKDLYLVKEIYGGFVDEIVKGVY